LIEFSKKIVMFVLVNSIVWIYLSYILAFLNKEIAENLSVTVVVQLVSVVFIYCLKALFENLSKHNSWPDKFDYSNNINEANDINVLDDNIPSI
jgi:ABC-type transport system involved in cytochrome bd biosynthesis fused ATPase/permease subunit